MSPREGNSKTFESPILDPPDAVVEGYFGEVGGDHGVSEDRTLFSLER
jgi:hypothetical protein